MDDARRNVLLKEYDQVGSNFRTLTDIRFKLLGLLPIASAAAVAVAFAKGEFAGFGTIMLALFGLTVTVGLILYNSRNDQLYDELVGRAAVLERFLGLPDGSFANRPRAWLSVDLLSLSSKVEHRNAITIVYASSVALWLTLLFAAVLDALRGTWFASVQPPLGVSVAAWMQVIAVLLAVGVTCYGVTRLTVQKKKQSDELRDLAAQAYKIAVPDDAAALPEPVELLKKEKFIDICAKLANDEHGSKTKARAAFYATQYAQSFGYYRSAASKEEIGSQEDRAAQLIALLTDLPPHWILDCGKNRKGLLPQAKGREDSASKVLRLGYASLLAAIVLSALILGRVDGHSTASSANGGTQMSGSASGNDKVPTIKVVVSGEATASSSTASQVAPGTTRAVQTAGIVSSGWWGLLSPLFIIGLTLIAAGAFLSRRLSAPARTAMLSIGALLSGAALIKEVKIDMFREVKIGSLVTVEPRAPENPPASGAMAGLEQLPSVSRFRLGSSDKFEDGVDADKAYRDIADHWLKNTKQGKQGTLLFIGSTDEVPLKAGQTRYEGNVGLARARAETVKNGFISALPPELRKEFPPNDARLVVLVSGPQQLRTGGADRDGSAKDRRVDVLAFWNPLPSGKQAEDK